MDMDARLSRLMALALEDEPEPTEEQKANEKALQKANDEYLELVCAGFPRRAVETLDKTEGNEWKQARFKAWGLANPGAIIVLTGGWGTGKTVMASSIARAMDRKGKTIMYAKAYNFTLELLEAPKKLEVMQKYERPYFLVLDEFHELSTTDTTKGAVERLVDSRHQNGKVTVIIANLKTERVEDNLGNAIASRMHAEGGIITCDWKSYREKK